MHFDLVGTAASPTPKRNSMAARIDERAGKGAELTNDAVDFAVRGFCRHVRLNVASGRGEGSGEGN